MFFLGSSKYILHSQFHNQGWRAIPFASCELSTKAKVDSVVKSKTAKLGLVDKDKWIRIYLWIFMWWIICIMKCTIIRVDKFWQCGWFLAYQIMEWYWVLICSGNQFIEFINMMMKLWYEVICIILALFKGHGHDFGLFFRF